MNRKWVLNASPLISLAAVSKINLLPELCTDLIIPEAVAKEIHAGPDDDPAKHWLLSEGSRFIKQHVISDPRIIAWDLGDGESQVLTWALNNPEYDAIIDDRAARNCARAFGIHIVGTMGVLILAKKDKKIDLIRPILQALMDMGFRIDNVLFQAVLRLADE